MAYSKIKPIKNTLSKAIQYVINEKKTDDKLLVTTHACSIGTADIEMRATAKNGSGKGNRIAYHLMQAFDPNDSITPKEAHIIGIEYMDMLYNGKYEYVLSTHIDKGHIHNHIIFNSVNMIDYKKYHIDDREQNRIREINDQVCQDFNISFIKETSGFRGKSYYENKQAKDNNSWKYQLQCAIDNAIERSISFSEFIEEIKKLGYEIKRGKHIAFRAIGQKRYTRSKRLGTNYTEAVIISRISKNDNSYSMNDSSVSKGNNRNENNKEHINLIVDISKNSKAKLSKGYENVVRKGNANTTLKTLNYLAKHNISSVESLNDKLNEVDTIYKDSRSSIRKLCSETNNVIEKIKFAQIYFKYKDISTMALGMSLSKDKFFKANYDSIVQYRVALKYFKDMNIDLDNINLENLFDEYNTLNNRIDILKKDLNHIKDLRNELYRVVKNVESILDIKLCDDRKKTNKHLEDDMEI